MREAAHLTRALSRGVTRRERIPRQFPVASSPRGVVLLVDVLMQIELESAERLEQRAVRPA